MISVGLAILALAMLMIFGLSGRSGRLSRVRADGCFAACRDFRRNRRCRRRRAGPRSDLGTRRLRRWLCWRSARATLTAGGSAFRVATPATWHFLLGLSDSLRR